MKPIFNYFLSVSFLLISGVCLCQQDVDRNGISSLKDSNHVNDLLDKAGSYYFSKPDSCLLIVKQALVLAQELSYTKGVINALNNAGESLRFTGDFPQALEMQFKALELNKQTNNKTGEALSLAFIGFTYADLNEFRKALFYMFQAKEMYGNDAASVPGCFNLSNIGFVYDGLKMLDSALYFQRKAQQLAADLPHGNLKILILRRLGSIYFKLGKYQEALMYYQTGLVTAAGIGDEVNPPIIQLGIAKIKQELNQPDSGLFYARKAFANTRTSAQKLYVLDAGNLLVRLFRERKMMDSVVFYQDIVMNVKDSLFGPEKFRQLQLFALHEQKQQQDIIQQQALYKNRVRTIALLSLVGFFLVVAFILFRNNRHKQQINQVLEKTLIDLKATQSQLIQSEKMASLGELTAGIAHEIQNPLNFVNNFSEVNKELVDELQQELRTGKTENAIEIADNIKANEEKINHHGKRADAIVKGMLQHSRSSSGTKERTDINALSEEYLRLAYHGLRAKDKSFNAKLVTQFDENIGKIDIVPQEIGRVILNLINNAFYAVSTAASAKADSGYEPTVTVTTKKAGKKVLISVKDNGDGIPSKVVDKIFQPFFTTKPTGQGTGLGLSLSYDIVKAHDGELKVETIEGEGSEFVIQLPIN